MEKLKGPRTHSDLQAVLFETDDQRRYTNTIDLYDIAPRFVFLEIREDDKKYLQSIKRNFEHDGTTYSLVLRPGRLIKPDGSDWEQFPGEREQIIEAVIMRMATDRGKLTVDNEKVRLSFTLYEISAELKKVEHTFGTNEIKAALTILHTATVEITRMDGKTTTILSSSSFPVLGLKVREAGERAYLEFNPMVENGIKHLRYRCMNHETLMHLPTPMSRWIYKKLCQTLVNIPVDQPTGVSMTAAQVVRDGGHAPRSRERDSLLRVTQAVKMLVRDGLIEECEPQTVTEKRKKVDIIYDMIPTAAFLEELRRADRLGDNARRELEAAAGQPNPKKFVQVENAEAFRVRARRKRIASEPTLLGLVPAVPAIQGPSA